MSSLGKSEASSDADANNAVSSAPSVFSTEIEGFTAQAKLSRRESDIVIALIRNITNSEEVASALGISTHTVNNHLKSIFEKTGTNSKTEILSSFLRYSAESIKKRGLFIRKPRVLVIDDEELICEYIVSGLRELGMRAYSISTPTRALEMISMYNIDFVVSDIRMPQMSGMQVLKSVRDVYRCWPHFVFITGFPDYTLEECMHNGASGFIEKPLELDKLFRTIMEHLVESSAEKLQLLELSSSQAIKITDPFRVGANDIGFGGAFLAMDGNTQKNQKINVGSIIDLRFMLPDTTHAIPVSGQVVWKRAAADGSKRAGIGVKFISMGDKDELAFQDWVRAKHIASFVPLGLQG